MSKIRKKVILILSVLMVGLMLIPPVTAQTSENLEWGLEVAEMFYFNIDYWEGGMVFHEDFYANVTGPIPAIPDPLTTFAGIPDIPLDIKLLNGSDMGMMALFVLFVMKATVPTGNWSLMTAILEDVTQIDLMGSIYPIDPIVIVDDWLHWGFSYNLSDINDIVIDVVYLKTDGLLASMILDSYVSGTSTPTGAMYVVRDGTAPDIDSPDDIDYTVGETGNEISWSATDQSPAGYILYKDDAELKRGMWNSSSETITVDVDGLAIGVYDYEIEFYEASGLSASDVVKVNVTAVVDTTTSTTTGTDTATDTNTTTTTGDFLSENLVLIISVGSGAIIIIVIVIIIKKR